jgi:hypothetical protein
MFSRIREAARIISYREPQHGPDFVIAEHHTPTTSRAGRTISNILEVLVAIYTLGYAAGYISEHLNKLMPSTRSFSMNTLTGGIGVLLAIVLNSFRDDIEKKIRARINLAEILAPYFGHRLDHTFRVLKG